MTFEKKVYTMEDNVKSISFGIKDLVKKLEEINISLQTLASFYEINSGKKTVDENEVPF